MTGETMTAMEFAGPGRPLRRRERARPRLKADEVLLRVRACGVCRTDLHLVDGELADPKKRVVPGHEIVGEVVARGSRARRFRPGARVGVPWLGRTCGYCQWCRSGRENLCRRARFTGYQLDGGYAEFAAAAEDYCFPLPAAYSDLEAAPLLCSGLIGYRALRAAGEARELGLYGFGAAAHLICQVARAQGRRVYAFTRRGDAEGQGLARRLGASWAGPSGEPPPRALDAAILFAPVGALVPEALRRVKPGGVVVCAGIHMSDIPAFPYALLWGERRLQSVANLTRRDAQEFLALAAGVRLRVEAKPYPLARANQALDDLRRGRVHGAAVLTPR